MNNASAIKGNTGFHIELERNTNDGANEPLNPTAKFACKGVTIERETTPFLSRMTNLISEHKALFTVCSVVAVIGVGVALVFVMPYIVGNNNDNTNNSNHSLPTEASTTGNFPTTEAIPTSDYPTTEAIPTSDSPTTEASTSSKWFPIRHRDHNSPINVSNQEQHTYKTCREFTNDKVECRESTMLSRVWEQRTKDIVVEDGNELVMLCKQRRRDGCNIVSRPKDFDLKA